MANGLKQFSLEGKVSLVTGGGRGIGLGIAKALAGAGSEVMLVSRTEAQLKAAADSILAACGRKPGTVCADVSDLASHAAIVDAALQRFGRIDVLVNNAGSNIRKPFLEVTVADYDTIMQVQLKSVFFLSQRLAMGMKGRRQDHQPHLSYQQDRNPQYLDLRGGQGWRVLADQEPVIGACPI
jgi:NAD(P)-dependent dehydrogenase (short-subunit alcohol dehydrogenase family)